jgi:23S rRNA pseudouridine2605 synthase
MSPVPVGHDDKPLQSLKTVYPQAMTEDIKDPPSPDSGSPGLGNSDEGERIAKRIARAGIASRREAERLIDAGRVTVNGEIMRSPALDVLPDDVITVDGVPVPKAERTRLWRYHKPAGLLVSRGDPQGRRTIYTELPPELSHAISVGRLDYTSEGLLLLTNDGELSRKLELPTGGMARRYRARAFGHIDQKGLDRLKDGITVDGIHYGPIEAKLEEARGANAWIALTLTEGKNREIRNVLRAIGLHVNRLIRTSYGPFQLGDMPPGAVAEVPAASLMRDLGIATERPKGWAKAKPKKQRPGKNARFSTRKPHGDAPNNEGRRGEHQSEHAAGRPEHRPYTPRPTEDRTPESRPAEHRPVEQHSSDVRPPKHRPGDRRPSGNFHGETGREKVGEDGNRVIPERVSTERRPDFRKEKRFSEPRKFEGSKPERREERPRTPRPQAPRDEGPRRDGHRTAPARRDERPRSERKEFDRPRTEDRPRAQRRQAERAEAAPRQEGPRRDGHPVRAVRSERRDDTRAAPRPYAARNNAERSESPRRDGPRPAFKPREDRSSSERSSSDRPPSDRPKSARPYPARGNPERSYYKRPDAERSESPRREGPRPGFKPRDDRSPSDRPRFDRPKSDHPKSERPYGARNASERTHSERPRSERPKPERTFERSDAPRKTAERSQAPRRDDNRNGPKGPPRGPNRGPSSGGPKSGGYRPRGPNADRRR